MVLSIRRFDSAKSDVSKDVNGFIKRELQEPSNTEDEKRFQPTELKPFVRENVGTGYFKLPTFTSTFRCKIEADFIKMFILFDPQLVNPLCVSFIAKDVCFSNQTSIKIK